MRERAGAAYGPEKRDRKITGPREEKQKKEKLGSVKMGYCWAKRRRGSLGWERERMEEKGGIGPWLLGRFSSIFFLALALAWVILFIFFKSFPIPYSKLKDLIDDLNEQFLGWVRVPFFPLAGGRDSSFPELPLPSFSSSSARAAAACSNFAFTLTLWSRSPFMM